jgi:hypothetical protein
MRSALVDNINNISVVAQNTSTVEINNSHSAQVSDALNPACKGYLRTLVIDAQLAACMCSVHI